MSLAQLLVVQAHDSAIDRLAHNRDNLPEFQALASIDEEQAHLETERAAVAEERHKVEREQKRLEDEAGLITERIDRENLRLYDGTVTAHKDLQAIQAEVATLGTRRAEIEDHVLEAMEQGEPLDASLAAFDRKLADVDARRAQATASLAESQAAIDAESSSETEQRVAAAEQVDAELLAHYETSRKNCGGVGVCRLLDKTCEGCHLTLPAVEIDRLRKEPEDAIVRCGECTRILVR
jgi:predicted  nucleic acid-binding Zn-ribbon protein